MAAVSIIICLVFLVIASFFLLGWIWPLVTGLVKRRRGEKATVWLVLGAVWGVGSLAVSALIGLAIFSIMSFSGYMDATEFDAAAYEGPTATIVAPYKGEATLTGNTADQGSLRFQSSDGTFIVPAGEIAPSAYAITEIDADGGYWHASWSLYPQKLAPFDLAEGGTAQFDRGPPLTMRVKRRELTGGNQNLGIEIFDRTGATVSVRGAQKPAIQIIDESGEVAWSKTLEYG